MAITTQLKALANSVLAMSNMKLDTLTSDRAEETRIRKLASNRYFDTPVFPVPDSFESNAYKQILNELQNHRSRFDSFCKAEDNDVGFSYENSFFSSPDADVLYTMVRMHRPTRIVEIGSGNSTLISRQAIRDGKLNTRLTSIDPRPRQDIKEMVDTVHLQTVESLESTAVFEELEPGDFLFIDSSHEVKTGNDCVYLYLRILPQLRTGVFVHAHDIYLPYDYPIRWAKTTHWAEQYLLQSLMSWSFGWEVLWAGHYLSRNLIKLGDHFPYWRGADSCSFWFRRAS